MTSDDRENRPPRSAATPTVARRSAVARSAVAALRPALACGLALMMTAPALAQVSGPPQAIPEPDLGPSARPTGVPPNSGLAPGRAARPPGDPNAYGPAGWPRPSPPRVEPLLPRTGDTVRPRSRAGRRPPALPPSRGEHCRRGDWRCR